MSLSRISPEKRIEDVIEILNGVRQRGHSVNLLLAGKIAQDSYGRRIKKLCDRNRGWITSVGHVSGRAKLDLLATSSFGISACRQEMLGNAVAEMIRSGVIPFAFCEGGPVEIINHPKLIFESRSDAVARIVQLVSTSCAALFPGSRLGCPAAQSRARLPPRQRG